MKLGAKADYCNEIIFQVSWEKQHSAPISGICFSPSSDKVYLLNLILTCLGE